MIVDSSAIIALVLEEPESIETDDEVFRRYLALTASVVASRGAAMLVGGTLGTMPAAVNRVWPLDVAAADAATMFSLNLATVRTDPWVVDHHDAAELDALGEALHERIVAPAGLPPVRWRLRQVVVADSVTPGR